MLDAQRGHAAFAAIARFQALRPRGGSRPARPRTSSNGACAPDLMKPPSRVKYGGSAISRCARAHLAAARFPARPQTDGSARVMRSRRMVTAADRRIRQQIAQIRAPLQSRRECSRKIARAAAAYGDARQCASKSGARRSCSRILLRKFGIRREESPPRPAACAMSRTSVSGDERRAASLARAAGRDGQIDGREQAAFGAAGERFGQVPDCAASRRRSP